MSQIPYQSQLSLVVEHFWVKKILSQKKQKMMMALQVLMSRTHAINAQICQSDKNRQCDVRQE